jgi:membrane protein DedA with SNARE-associated domain
MQLGNFINNIKIWVEGIISSGGYPGLFFVMFLENVFPPIPSEVVLPLAGSLSLTGRFTIPLITIVGMLGSLTGAFLFYALGKWLGETRVRNFIGKYGKFALLSVEDFDKSKTWFDKYDEWVIFFSRMVPIVRSLISIPAGVSSMNLAKFSIYTILGTALWSFILSYAGRLLGEKWPVITDFINTYQNIVLAVGLFVVVAFITNRLVRKKKSAN